MTNIRNASDHSIEKWDEVIESSTSFFALHLKDVWQYRDLLILFVKRDFTAQYKQTILGPVWHLIQPLLTTIIFLLLFGKIANIPTDGIEPVLFYMSGITVWNFFSTCLTSTASTFTANASIFGKVYFPRLVMPLSVILSNMIRLGIQFGLLFIAMLWFYFHDGVAIQITTFWFFIPLIIIWLGCLGLGLGIIVSSLTTKYRDLTVLMVFMVQLWMYVSPIGYPMSYLAKSKYSTIIKLNPLSSIIETFRYTLFKKGTLDFHNILYSIIFTIICLFSGLLIFNRVEKTFMDTV